MTTIRILHVDDEPDIREVAEISLGLDPKFVTRSCGSGQDALMVAANWLPHVILLDVMMPVMDGPATLARLRENPKTAGIRVIFMTARAQTRELDRFRSLGAVGVIPKPFDPMTLAASVRSYLKLDDPLEDLRAGFLLRVKKDAATLAMLRTTLRDGTDVAGTLAAIKQVAHGLAGAGGIFGFAEISDAAAALEDEAITEMAAPGLGESLDCALDHLTSCGGSPINALRFWQDA
jgi:CheY-like chemotaxis protein/HPt (histidine-containing phosphotransfer) domain-containing protein